MPVGRCSFRGHEGTWQEPGSHWTPAFAGMCLTHARLTLLTAGVHQGNVHITQESLGARGGVQDQVIVVQGLRRTCAEKVCLERLCKVTPEVVLWVQNKLSCELVQHYPIQHLSLKSHHHTPISSLTSASRETASAPATTGPVGRNTRELPEEASSQAASMRSGSQEVDEELAVATCAWQPRRRMLVGQASMQPFYQLR